jgi:hypothetical protein
MANMISLASGIIKGGGGLANTIKTALAFPSSVTWAEARVTLDDGRKIAPRLEKIAARLNTELKQSELMGG